MNAAGFFAATGRRSLPCNAVSIGQKGLLISSVFWPDIGERIRLILDFKAIEPLDGPLFATKEVALKKTTSHIQCEVVDQEKQGFFVWLNNKVYETMYAQAELINSNALKANHRHFRVKPKTPTTNITTKDNLNGKAEILNFSLSGVAIETDIDIKIGDEIIFKNNIKAKVVRNLEPKQYGLQFKLLLPKSGFNWFTRL
jgi:hypothetical protein